jgi:hypothetical protein
VLPTDRHVTQTAQTEIRGGTASKEETRDGAVTTGAELTSFDCCDEGERNPIERNGYVKRGAAYLKTQLCVSHKP